MGRLFWCGVLTLAAACADSGFTEREGEAAPPANTSLRYLCDRFTGGPTAVESDLIVSGRVTTSDRAGNFYRTLCIEEEGAGLEIMAGADHLSNDYPVGTLLVVRLRGLTLGFHYGVLQAGAASDPASGYPTGYLPSRPALDAAVVRSTVARTEPEPARCTIDGLTPKRCGTLVRIEGLRYDPVEIAPGTTWAGYRRFTDDEGRVVYTYVRNYASFASEEIPIARCALTGILQYDDAGEGRYIIKMRDATDCAL